LGALEYQNSSLPHSLGPLVLLVLPFALHLEFGLQLFLLLLRQHAQLAHNFRIVLQAAGPDDVSGLAVPLSLGYFVVFGAHMHVSSRIRRVDLPTVVEARKIFLKLLGAPPDVLFPELTVAFFSFIIRL